MPRMAGSKTDPHDRGPPLLTSVLKGQGENNNSGSNTHCTDYNVMLGVLASSSHAVQSLANAHHDSPHSQKAVPQGFLICATARVSSPLLGQAISYWNGDWDQNVHLPRGILRFDSKSSNCRCHVTATEAAPLWLSVTYTFKAGTNVIMGGCVVILLHRFVADRPLIVSQPLFHARF